MKMMNRNSFTNSLLSTISASRKISRYTYQPLQAEVSRYGALTALKNMLHRSMYASRLPKDYDLFWLNGRMDLLVETLVLDSRYIHLFTAEEIAFCRELVTPKAA